VHPPAIAALNALAMRIAALIVNQKQLVPVSLAQHIIWFLRAASLFVHLKQGLQCFLRPFSHHKQWLVQSSIHPSPANSIAVPTLNIHHSSKGICTSLSTNWPFGAMTAK